MPAVGVGTRPPMGRRRRWPWPTQVDRSNLVLWLRADQGVTLSSASIANGSDFGTGWTTTQVTVAVNTAETTDPAGTNLADKITETNVASANHRIFEASTNFQTGPGMWMVSAKNGVTNGRRYIFVGPAATDGSFFDLQAGVVISNVGTGVGRIVSLGNGWYDCITTTTVAGANFQVFLSTDGATILYNGDGVSNVYLYNARLIQDRVSAWADQSGLGNHATQATAGSQWIYQELDGAGLWVPTGTTGVTKWLGNPADAEKRMDLPAALYNLFTGDGLPQTVIAVATRIASPAVATFGALRLSGATPARRDVMQLSAANKFVEAHVADDSGSANYTTNSTTTTAKQSAVSVITPTTDSVYLDGVADSLNPRAVDLNTQTWTASNTNARSRVYNEIAMWKSALSDTDRKRVENGARARGGLAPI